VLDSGRRWPVRPSRVPVRSPGGPDPPSRAGRARARRTGPHGVTRACRGSGAGSSAQCWSSAPGWPFRRRSGLPSHTAGRHPSIPVTPLLASRAPSGHTPEDRRRPRGRTAPSWASVPYSARGVTGPVPVAPLDATVALATRACHTRHLPSSAFRTPSTACSLRPRPGLSRPGDAPGVSSSGPCSAPGGPCPSRGRCSPAVEAALSPAAKRDRRPPASERCSHRSVRAAAGRNPRAVVALMTFAPLRRSPPPRRDRLLDPWTALFRAPGTNPFPRPFLPCPSPCGGGFGVLPAEA